MRNQPVTIMGMGKQPVTTAGMGKQPTTMATVTRMPCVVTGMKGTTTIGGNNTTLLSCWSEADTIITTRDIGILHGDTILIMSATIRWTDLHLWQSVAGSGHRERAERA